MGLRTCPWMGRSHQVHGGKVLWSRRKGCPECVPGQVSWVGSSYRGVWKAEQCPVVRDSECSSRAQSGPCIYKVLGFFFQQKNSKIEAVLKRGISGNKQGRARRQQKDPAANSRNNQRKGNLLSSHKTMCIALHPTDIKQILLI